jgi:hypothetical protein
MIRTALLALVFASACGSDGGGTAPSIASLTYSPMTVTHGQQATVAGTFTFDDKDGDLAELGAEITLPDNSKQNLPMTDISNVGDMKQGTLQFQMIVTPPTAGSYQFALFVTDDGDNESNRLTGTVTAN